MAWREDKGRGSGSGQRGLDSERQAGGELDDRTLIGQRMGGVGLVEANSGTRYFRLEVSLAGPTATGLLRLPLCSQPRAQAEGGGSGRCRRCTCTRQMFP